MKTQHALNTGENVRFLNMCPVGILLLTIPEAHLSSHFFIETIAALIHFFVLL